MKLHRDYTLTEIAQLVSGEAIGEAGISSTGINEIHLVNEGDIAFVDHPKYYKPTLNSVASVIIIDQKTDCPHGKALIVHPEPFNAFNFLTQHFKKEIEQQLSPDPVIHGSAKVMPGAYIGNYVKIGERSIIHPGAVIYDHCVIGDDVTIHANTVIGSDAFYFKRRENKHDKLISVGNVIIENGVEIGSGCTIDRGSTGSTIIGEGSKLDNQVHIGHDTVIGKMCLFAAQVGIAGCVTIKDNVVMWGQVGCAANIEVGEGAVVYAQSGVAKSLNGGQTYFGSPAIDARLKMREIATISNLTRKL